MLPVPGEVDKGRRKGQRARAGGWGGDGTEGGLRAVRALLPVSPPVGEVPSQESRLCPSVGSCQQICVDKFEVLAFPCTFPFLWEFSAISHSVKLKTWQTISCLHIPDPSLQSI